MSKTNLLKETQSYLSAFDKSLDDILWVGTKEYQITVSTFLELADFDYDSSHSAGDIADDLIIVGDGWYIERINYRGETEWNIEKTLTKPKEIREVKSLSASQSRKLFNCEINSYSSLSELNLSKIT